MQQACGQYLSFIIFYEASVEEIVDENMEEEIWHDKTDN